MKKILIPGLIRFPQFIIFHAPSKIEESENNPREFDRFNPLL